ncbi:MAG: ModD protein [Syntrophomonadaceae bacterium]|nr:ModD protein [Syntrophomonadaceae bacterium]MDD3023890.1 ModD protein [Syntrophomonadaceae bacterium]
MVYIAEETIDRFIKEDIPYIDLTSIILEIAGIKGKMEFVCREEAVICGTEEVLRIFNKFNIIPVRYVSSGTKVNPGTCIMEAEGNAENLHMAWKPAMNILEYTSGIASRTRRLVDKAKAVNPKIEINTTRKIFPGTKEMSIKAVLAGGGMPHRLGLSETVLIFKQHLNFIGGFEGLNTKLNDLKARACEKKFIVEVENQDEAVKVCRAGADGIQLDKVSPDDLQKIVPIIKSIDSKILILAAGGINESNVEAYAQTGVDALVTTSVYFGKPVDIGTRIIQLI